MRFKVQISLLFHVCGRGICRHLEFIVAAIGIDLVSHEYKTSSIVDSSRYNNNDDERTWPMGEAQLTITML